MDEVSLYVTLGVKKIKDLQKPLAWQYSPCSLQQRYMKWKEVQDNNNQPIPESEKYVTRLFRVGFYTEKEICGKVLLAIHRQQFSFINLNHIDPHRFLSGLTSFVRNTGAWSTCRVRIHPPGFQEGPLDFQEKFYTLGVKDHFVLGTDEKEQRSFGYLLAGYTKYGITEYLDKRLSKREVRQILSDPNVIRVVMVQFADSRFSESEMELLI